MEVNKGHSQMWVNCVYKTRGPGDRCCHKPWNMLKTSLIAHNRVLIGAMLETSAPIYAQFFVAN